MNIKSFVKAVWELPQNVIGFIVKQVCRASFYTTYKDANIYSWNINGGMSLGKYVFVPFKQVAPTTSKIQQFLKHEYGHTIQSKYLGWLYLPVIALPSLLWAQCFKWYWTKPGKSYYVFYTESSADRLGGVERR